MEYLDLRYALLPLADIASVQCVKLFGSRAKMTHQPHSDYDLAVFTLDLAVSGHKDVGAEWEKIETIISEALLMPTDIVDMANASDEIRRTVDAVGKTVYYRADWYVALVRLAKAMHSLTEVIHDEEDAKHKQRDSVIARFQYVFELFWKLFKELQEREGFAEKSPRAAIARAFQLGWIENESLWQDMLRDRNNIAHSYNEALARQIYRNIQSNYPELLKTYESVERQVLQLMENTDARR